MRRSSKHLLQYSTSNLSSKDLVRFFYKLKGRKNSKGFIEKTNSRFIKKTILEVPSDSLKKWDSFLKKWLCKYRILKEVSKNKATHRVFTFDSSKLKGSKKTRFYYALKGRGKKKGILEKTNSEYLARSVILTSNENYFELMKFLKQWKCKFEIKEVKQ